MEKKSVTKEVLIILITVIILSISYLYPEIQNLEKFVLFFAGFLLVITVNTLAKKITAYNLEANVNISFWSWYYFGFKEKEHFKSPLPMPWLPPLLSFISNGAFAWLPILEFEVSPRVERVAKRHELYRFREMTEWHIALIAFWGIIANIFFYLLLNLFGMNELARISLYYSIWSLVPLGNLDGTKLLFGSRKLWLTTGIIILLAFIWQSALF